MFSGTFGGNDSREATAKQSSRRAPSPRRKKASRPTLFLAVCTPTLLACPAAHCISLNFVQLLLLAASLPLPETRFLFFIVSNAEDWAGFSLHVECTKVLKRKLTSDVKILNVRARSKDSVQLHSLACEQEGG